MKDSRKLKKEKEKKKKENNTDKKQYKSSIASKILSATKAFDANIWFILPTIALSIILLVFVVTNAVIKKQLTENTVKSTKKVEIQKYPFVNPSLAPEITAESAIIMDDTARVVIYEKNPTLRFSMASTTKIMTALVALSYFEPDNILTVKSMHEEGVVEGFKIGEQIYFKDLLYALLLPSANDAAYVISENYPGGNEVFVKDMNKKAQDLKLYFTHYADPAGLDDDGNYTTVIDLIHLASYAIKNPIFAQIISTKSRIITSIDGKEKYILINLNKLLGQDGVGGIKTGYTEGAGEVLVTLKKERDHNFILAVMKSNDRFTDTQKLLGYITKNVQFINPESELYKN